MTVEEIEIIVTAKVEEALKEFKKIQPELEKAMQEMAKQMSKIDMKAIVQKVQKAAQDVKNKIQLLKKSTEKNKIQIKISNNQASDQITQLEKEIDSLQKKITSRQLKLNVTTDSIDKIRYGKQDEIRKENPNLSDMQVSNRADFQLDSDVSYTSLVAQADKLNNEIIAYNSLLDSAKNRLNVLEQNTNQVSLNQDRANQSATIFQSVFLKASNLINNTKNNLSSFSGRLESVKGIFDKIFSLAGKVGSAIKKYTPSISGGMKSLLKYAATLVSIKSIYSGLSSVSQTWLSSQNIAAQQLSANIEYMKYAMGSALSPVIQFVTNLFYNLLKAIQSVIYALFNVNIFAKAGASAYSSMANSASKASKANKSLSGIHNEINNVSSGAKENSSGGGSIAPSFDLSNLDTQLSPLQQKLVDFFRPLIESWNTYSPSLITSAQQTFSQIALMLESVGQSFINIFANGTVYAILENILAIIGNIAEAFANAWNYNGSGDIIVQNLANAFNNLLNILNMITNSTIFQWLIDVGVSAIALVTEAIETVSEATLWVCERIGEFVSYFTGENSEKISFWAIILGSLATSILLVVSAVTAWNVISTIATAATTAFGVALNILTSPITLIILAIAAVIAIIAYLIVYWDEVKEVTFNTIEAIKEFISNAVEKIKEIFTNIINWVKENWQGLLLLLVNPFAGAFKLLYDNCEGFRNFINNFVQSVIQFFQNLWQNVKNIFSNIGNFFAGIWNGIANTFSLLGTNIANAISNAVKVGINGVITLIENTINSAIGLINGGINLINNIPGVSIGLIGYLSFPRLAKGGVLTSPTFVQAGEYIGAAHNPEIVSPQNLMYDTFVKALRDNNDTDAPINLRMEIKIGNKSIGQIAIEDIKNTKRVTGMDLEAIFN